MLKKGELRLDTFMSIWIFFPKDFQPVFLNLDIKINNLKYFYKFFHLSLIKPSYILLKNVQLKWIENFRFYLKDYVRKIFYEELDLLNLHIQKSFSLCCKHDLHDPSKLFQLINLIFNVINAKMCHKNEVALDFRK